MCFVFLDFVSMDVYLGWGGTPCFLIPLQGCTINFNFGIFCVIQVAAAIDYFRESNLDLFSRWFC